MPRNDGSNHNDTRDLLRVVGPLVLGVGVIFTIVGFVSFFSTVASFGSGGHFGPPRFFWCAFVGLPLMGLGGAICRFAFFGAVTRYMADEVKPVAKDVINYMADGTKDAVRDVAAAIGEGIASARTDRDDQAVRCRKCDEWNDPAANFCKGCGVALRKSTACPKCGESNDADARFCDHCGTALG